MSTRQAWWVNLILDVFIQMGGTMTAAIVAGSTWKDAMQAGVLFPAIIQGARAIQSAIRNVKTDLEAPKGMQPVDVSIFGRATGGNSK
jgi:hypothetical protein